MNEFGAPDEAAAMVAVTEEIKFMADLCAEHKTGTLLAIQRSLGDDGIRESFAALPSLNLAPSRKYGQWSMMMTQQIVQSITRMVRDNRHR
jgi:hypothetical protein